jgi:hypothetical protein
MNFLALVLGFVGYTLVYAATANHGRFATAPWTGVLVDAYNPGGDPNYGSGSAQGNVH